MTLDLDIDAYMKDDCEAFDGPLTHETGIAVEHENAESRTFIAKSTILSYTIFNAYLAPASSFSAILQYPKTNPTMMI